MTRTLLDFIDELRSFVEKENSLASSSKKDLADGVQMRLVVIMQTVLSGPSMGLYSLPYPDNQMKTDTSDHSIVQMHLDSTI